MREQLLFETTPLEIDPEAPGVSRTGRWFRQGRNTIVLTDSKALPADSEIYGVPTGGIPSRKDLIDPRIDFYAQEALYRMFKGNPSARVEAAQMFAAIKTGQLTGIYIVNQGVPAMRAQRMKLGWWQVIPKGEEAILLLDPASPMAGPPLIAFRHSVKSDPSRLDPALRKAWGTFQLLRTRQLTPCEAAPAGVSVSNLVPMSLCRAPRIGVPGTTVPPGKGRPTIITIVRMANTPPRTAESSLQRQLASSTSQPPPVVLSPGEAATITATAIPRPDGTPTYTWTSSDSTVADLFVVTKGTQAHPSMVFVTGNKPGAAIITVTAKYRSGETVKRALDFTVDECPCLTFSASDLCGDPKPSVVLKAFSEARTWLEPAKTKIENYIKSPRHPANKVAADALKGHFNWTEAIRTRATFIDIPLEVLKVIEDLKKRISIPICSDCPSKPSMPGGEKDINKVFASSPRPWSGTNCYQYFPRFFDKTDDVERARIILHEMVHSWRGAGDIAYEGNADYPPPPETAWDNADSFAALIRDLRF